MHIIQLARKGGLLVAVIGILLGVAGAAGAKQQHPPGSPLQGISFDFDLKADAQRLPARVEEGDVVLLDHGSSRDPANWVCVVRFENRAYGESQVGYASVAYDHLDQITLSSNVVFVTKAHAGASAPVPTETLYKASRGRATAGASYRIHHSAP